MKPMEWEDGFRFEILAEDVNSRARVGRLITPHGVIHTPAFMPVGTYGAVKGISPDELQDAGAQVILSNALHLEFRPGSQTVATLGGIHHLMGWDGPILTDSGGFQTYSLKDLMRSNSEGIEVRAPLNGNRFFFTPAKVIEIQRNLGTDLMMPLDICPPGNSDRKTQRLAMDTTMRWAEQSKETYEATKPLYGKPQALFGIAQGGTDEEQRREAVDSLVAIGFFGYAIGGLAVGESRDDTWRIVSYCDCLLPREKPRYLMGAGTPEDLQTAVSLGVDLFDCVLPTRNGRKGSLFTNEGKLNLRNAAFKDDLRPVMEGCCCYACTRQESGFPRFSRGAMRHLITSGDPLGARLGALHNLTFYLQMLSLIRSDLLNKSAVNKRGISKKRTPVNQP